MSPEDLERLLAESFDSRTREAVGDSAPPPPPRYSEPAAAAAGQRRRPTRLLAPLAAAAVVAALIGLVVTLTGPATTDGHPQARPSLSGFPSATPHPTRPIGSTAPGGHSVRVAFAHEPTHDVGVGLPVVADFAVKITDGRAWEAATTVTANGQPVRAAWYFENTPLAAEHHALEAHLRPRGYWPAHAHIVVTVAAKGRSAGSGLTFGRDLTTSFTTGPRRIATVDNRSHMLTVTQGRTELGRYPVSLGTQATPTFSGTKVIMQQRTSICMGDSAGTSYECGIKYDQRLTYSGEYLHAAPWNIANIKGGVNTSNGCTQLLPADARRLYGLLTVGDVVRYPNATGPEMTLGEGFGDWNVPWSQWRTGGAVPTH